jgi:hypothetical protein
MRITACTERIFLKQLAPLAHLPVGEVCAVNDNELQFPIRPALGSYRQPRSGPGVRCGATCRSRADQETAEGGFHS